MEQRHSKFLGQCPAACTASCLADCSVTTSGDQSAALWERFCCTSLEDLLGSDLVRRSHCGLPTISPRRRGERGPIGWEGVLTDSWLTTPRSRTRQCAGSGG